jgi:hypothetical protein
MRHIDHAAPDACRGQRGQVMVEQRSAPNLDHGLWGVVGQRPQSLSASCGENHGLARHCGGDGSHHRQFPKQEAQGKR